jgi:CCR4-NOT transcription complex subunit 6
MGSYLFRPTPIPSEDEKVAEKLKKPKITMPGVCKNTFSITTYNILADAYSEYHRDCRPEYLDFNYRKHKLSEELKNFETDFICLQEVDKYNEYFKNTLKSLGYQCEYVKRPSGYNPDGSLIAWKTSSWRVLEVQKLNFNLHPKCESNSAYRKNNIGLLIVFQHTSNQSTILIGTAHLYWDPALEYVKFLQGVNYLNEAYNLKNKYQCSVVLTGDFNSLPDSHLVNYIVNKPFKLSSSEVDKEIKSFCIDNRLKLKSCYENYDKTGHPEFSNYTSDFKGFIDYIFCSDELLTTSLGRLPSRKDLKNVIGIPNQDFPSDHLPLTAEIGFKV